MSEATGDSFSLKESLDRVRHYLPIQGPLKNFVHNNPLRAFQHLPFETALGEASKMMGAHRTLSLPEYRKLIEAERIDRRLLDRLLAERGLAFDPSAPDSERPAPDRWFRRGWDHLLGNEFDGLVNPLLVRLTSQFLDQGISQWPMPGADELSFLECIRQLALCKGLPLVPLDSEECRRLLSLEPEQIVTHALERLVAEPEMRERYLRETLLVHAGWSGIVSVIESKPEILPKPRRISLLEFVAVKLAIEVGTLRRNLGEKFAPLSLQESPAPASRNPDAGQELRLTLQTALEESYYRQILRALRFHRAPLRKARPNLQVFFCLDDREGPLRRHLESLDSSVETFGMPGFFGVDVMHWREGERFPTKSCPVPVEPKHLLMESPASHDKRGKLAHDFHGPKTKSISTGWLHIPLLGLRATLRLLFDIFSPTTHAMAYGVDDLHDDIGPLHVRRDESRDRAGLTAGYTIQEMADRVARLCKAIALTEFAPLVVVIGHRSSSVNNPYFAAYDCAACSGNPGVPNARAFALMANLPEVRADLASRHGIQIPESTRFVAGVHDTCRDEVTYFDLETHDKATREKHVVFARLMEQALDLNARERCHRFELVDLRAAEKRPRASVRSRAVSIFEPRPELGHTDNALCIVGRRDLSRGLSLDRRSFLQSYDPRLDPDGTILEEILSAAVPVCAMVNLDYYFGRLDNRVYGSGSKLPHNIVGLLGVSNGAIGDLLTGIPSQMTELHEPIRLMFIVEQSPGPMEALLARNPAIAAWIEKRWVHLTLVQETPSGRRFQRYANGRFHELAEGDFQ